MKKRQSTPEQIVKKRRSTSEELEVSLATCHRRNMEYGGAKMGMVKELEKENARFKKLVAEQTLNMDMLKEVSR